MHIPDGFLSTPVWAALDVVALPLAGVIANRAQACVEDRRLPLMGVMGAFVFAAQMINFPVGVGTSSHLVGGALLALSLGPAMATVVMTAILAIQALVFQDGGVLALGANVLNMAVFGVWAGYLPVRIFGRTRTAVFAAGFLSVFVSALLAVSELMFSGVRIGASVLAVQLAFFAVAAACEGAITLAVVNALERMNRKYLRTEQATGARVYAALALAAILLVTVGVLVASTNPDGLESLAQNAGFAERARALVNTPFADYEWTAIEAPWLRRASAGLMGITAIFLCVSLFGRLAGKRPQAQCAPRVSQGD